jgi:hypothetical protein
MRRKVFHAVRTSLLRTYIEVRRAAKVRRGACIVHSDDLFLRLTAAYGAAGVV